MKNSTVLHCRRAVCNDKPSACTAAKIIIAAVFAVLLIVGLAASGGYGVTGDEATEINIQLSNIKELAGHFLGEDSALMYKLEELGIERISQSIERDHGEAVYYPFALFSLLSDLDLAQRHLAFVLYTFCISFVGVLFMYFLIRELYGNRGLALCMSLILYVSPRFFADGHFNNKDIVLLVLLIGSLLFAVLAARRDKFIYVLAYSFVTGLACNTKLIGLFFFAVTGLMYIVYVTAAKAWNRSRVIKAVCAVLLTALVYFLVTPAMWASPIQFFKYSIDNMFGFSRWNEIILYDGKLYAPADGGLPRSYLPKLIFLTVPPFVLLLALVGAAAGIIALRRKEHASGDFKPLFLGFGIFASLFPLLLTVAKGSVVVYNGWRHFYFAYLGILLLAAEGLDRLLRLKARPVWLAAAVCIIFTAVGLAVNHPYQMCYYNVFAGSHAETRYEMDYWNVAMYSALRTMLENDSRDYFLMDCIEDSSFFGVLSNASLLSDKDAERLSYARDDQQADYIIVNLTYWYRWGCPTIPDGFAVKEVLSAYGNDIIAIYGRSDA